MKQILRNKHDASLAIKKLEVLKFETKTGKPISYRFECVKNVKRTLSQNSYYWGVVLKVIADETGNSAEMLHEYFKSEFLDNRFVENKVFEKTVIREISTTELDSKVFTCYIEKIRSFASSELSCYVPDANEVPDYMRY